MKRTTNPERVSAAWIITVAFLISGCTHPLAIRNMSSYQGYGIAGFDRQVKIGIVADVAGQDERALMEGTASALGRYSAQVIMPYQTGMQQVDVIAHMDVISSHEGSGWNFLVNFPGFLVFAPAWNGYLYKVDYTINCTLKNGATKEVIDQFTIPITLDIRHAAINRTWTEVSWFEVGIIAGIGGIVFINYDNSVTPLLTEKIEVPIGKFVAHEIVKHINARGGLSQLWLIDQSYLLASASGSACRR
jgi:hypothetical protein